MWQDTKKLEIFQKHSLEISMKQKYELVIQKVVVSYK